MTAIPPKPNLVKSTALAKTQATGIRFQSLVSASANTELNPVTIYQPTTTLGGVLTVPTQPLPSVFGFYGSWTAPDLNNGQPYPVQVECFGPAGGGGGGIATAGGGGGGGGEYACESVYTVQPNVSYTYVVGLPGSPGCNNSSAESAQQGTAGSQTIFDIAGIGIPGGVVANPGQPGDIGSTGVGGQGGTGSANTVHFNGGNGGTNQSGLGSDNPQSLAGTTGMFVGNTLSTLIISGWYILNDGPDNTYQINEVNFSNTATVTNYIGGLQLRNTSCPAQVPAYTTPASPPTQPNPTTAGVAPWWKMGSNTSPSSKIVTPAITFQGTKVTVSCWIQCDPSGTWGNNSAGGIGTIAANSAFYAGGGSFTGYGLYMQNTGSVGTPAWTLNASFGNGTNHNVVSTALAPVPGTWTYVVATFNSGTITLYVNGASVGTAAAGFASLPGGAYSSTLGLNAATSGSAQNTNWYFGFISNAWFANDCATSTLVTQAYGLTSPTAGAGGGASGGPGGAGGAGASAAGATGGAGGTAAAVPVSIASVRTAPLNGSIGANAGTGAFPLYSTNIANGGGGSGDMGGSPAATTLVIPFATAATYCGPDAQGGNAGALFSPNQQTTAGVLYTGGLPADVLSGTKNTLMLLPPGVAAMLGSGNWTVQQVSLTFTNAQPGYATATILEFAYSSDKTLPVNFQGNSVGAYVGDALVGAGAGTVTYDLTQSNLPTYLANGSATALIFGPTNNVTFDAYNTDTGAQFYNQFYGVGATDSFGNSLAPYLTVVLQKTATTQTGALGGQGAIYISQLNNAGYPIATVQPYATTDTAGNHFAQGYTGQANAFDPNLLTAGSYAPETWHTISLTNSWAAGAGGWAKYRLTSQGDLQISMLLFTIGTKTDNAIMASAVFTGVYAPLSANHTIPANLVGTGMTPSPNAYGPMVYIDSSGNLKCLGVNVGTVTSVHVEGTIPLGV